MILDLVKVLNPAKSFGSYRIWIYNTAMQGRFVGIVPCKQCGMLPTTKVLPVQAIHLSYNCCRGAWAEPGRQSDQLADGDDCVGVAGGAGPGGSAHLPTRLYHTEKTVSIFAVGL